MERRVSINIDNSINTLASTRAYLVHKVGEDTVQMGPVLKWLSDINAKLVVYGGTTERLNYCHNKYSMKPRTIWITESTLYERLIGICPSAFKRNAWMA